MRKAITQEYRNGCGIACFAFACNITYQQAEKFLGIEQARSDRFFVKDFVRELCRYGRSHKAIHVRSGRKIIHTEGMIVLIRRSRRYPVGHYLIRHVGHWMDPWINVVEDKNLANARSGYRKKLPGQPMYALSQIDP